jgi:BirA family transcriptional regulator, biotin operon repressor / biotin---[acetyl-CoA-carboxylase] ligase
VLIIALKLSIDLPYLRQSICANRPDVNVDWVDTTTSTNQVLSEEKPSVPSYKLLGADVQTAGRGRRQRPWLSVAGQCATFSLRLPSYDAIELQYLPSLPLVVGLAVIDAVQSWTLSHGLALQGVMALKWPNDVLCDEKKVAGILIESRSSLVIGIGVNVFLSPHLRQSLPQKVAKKTDLTKAIEAGGLLVDVAVVNPIILADLVSRIVLEVLKADETHRVVGLIKNADRWNALHIFHGREVCLTDDEQLVQQGVVQGIGTQGELLLRNSLGQVNRVLSGDLSLRQVA